MATKTHYSRQYDVQNRKEVVLDYLRENYNSKKSKIQYVKQLIKESIKRYEDARYEYQSKKHTMDRYKIELDARRAALKELQKK